MSCLSALCDLYILYTFIYFLCTFMKYTFCSLHLEQKCIQKVHIFVHALCDLYIYILFVRINEVYTL